MSVFFYGYKKFQYKEITKRVHMKHSKKGRKHKVIKERFRDIIY